MTALPVEPSLQRSLLARYLAGHGRDPVGARALAARFGLLPIYRDMGGFVGLREDGELLELAWDPPYAPTLLTDPHLRRVALAVAARDVAELGFLAPARPANAVPCPQCGGSGHVIIDGREVPPNVLCYCAGLGWVPADEAAALRDAGA